MRNKTLEFGIDKLSEQELSFLIENLTEGAAYGCSKDSKICKSILNKIKKCLDNESLITHITNILKII